MIRRLILLNLVLLAALGFLIWQLRERVRSARAREDAMLLMHVPPADVPKPPPLGKVAPVDATSYQDIVMKNLFSQDRNPVPILDPPPPPPPPDPVPSFPAARGVMLWEGMPPAVVLSSSKGASDQRSYHPGESIGPWKVVSVDHQFIVLQWRDQQFKKRLDELMDRTPLTMAEAPQQQQNAPNMPAAQPVKALGDSNNQGIDIGGGIKACVAGDTQPTGSVVAGLKKIVSQTPFGTVCRWEPAK